MKLAVDGVVFDRTRYQTGMQHLTNRIQPICRENHEETSICVKSAFNEMIHFCTKQSCRVDTREWNHIKMIRFCTKRFGSAASCIRRSRGLDSFLFQTRLVRSGAKLVHLFRWFTFALNSKPCRRESKTGSTRVDRILHEIQMRWYGGNVNQH